MIAYRWFHIGVAGSPRPGVGRELAAWALIALGSAFGWNTRAQTDDRVPPKQLYNEGTQKFEQGKLREAEASLQSAVATQDPKVQIDALYNLGHVRFQQGIRELKSGPPAQASDARAKQACDLGDQALRAADLALAGPDVNALVEAYMQGRGARKAIKAATEAVKHALESYGTVLAKWQRASGDFKSAHELRSAETEARFNAEVVDRNIARLVDTRQLMMKSQQCLNQSRMALKQKMGELKKRMPKEQQQQCSNGDDEDEEEDQGKPPPEPKPDQREAKPREGREMVLTPDEAERLLEMLKLDGNRKLPLGMEETTSSKERKRREW